MTDNRVPISLDYLEEEFENIYWLMKKAFTVAKDVKNGLSFVPNDAETSPAKLEELFKDVLDCFGRVEQQLLLVYDYIDSGNYFQGVKKS